MLISQQNLKRVADLAALSLSRIATESPPERFPYGACINVGAFENAFEGAVLASMVRLGVRARTVPQRATINLTFVVQCSVVSRY
jgi:hypothetical protein